ncbi:hypothetical protein AAHE18_16G073600 [Arachis hypogaea]
MLLLLFALFHSCSTTLSALSPSILFFFIPNSQNTLFSSQIIPFILYMRKCIFIQMTFYLLIYYWLSSCRHKKVAIGVFAVRFGLVFEKKVF